MYRAPDNIPDESWATIKQHHGIKSSTPTYFLDSISDEILREMIMETCKKASKFHIDATTQKKIFRALKYDQPIGTDNSNGDDCHWLVVVAKRNSWIVVAYPAVNVTRYDG